MKKFAIIFVILVLGVKVYGQWYYQTTSIKYGLMFSHVENIKSYYNNSWVYPDNAFQFSIKYVDYFDDVMGVQYQCNIGTVSDIGLGVLISPNDYFYLTSNIHIGYFPKIMYKLSYGAGFNIPIFKHIYLNTECNLLQTITFDRSYSYNDKTFFYVGIGLNYYLKNIQ